MCVVAEVILDKRKVMAKEFRGVLMIMMAAMVRSTKGRELLSIRKKLEVCLDLQIVAI